MKMKPHMGFLDAAKPAKTSPASVKALYKDLLKGVGKPCEAYAPSCPSCKVWASYAVIVEFYL